MFIVFWKVVNELNIAFPFVILMSQNHIQRNSYGMVFGATQFHSIESKH